MEPRADATPRPKPASAAPTHPCEFERLASVCGLAVCDRGLDPTLDALARQAAELCRVPYAIVSLVRERDQIPLGRFGLDPEPTDRDQTICAHTLLADETFVVEDLLADARFAELPVASAPLHIRCYAGAPIRDRTGLPVGSLCVLGTSPCAFDSRCLFALAKLATLAGVVLETRRFAVELLGPVPRPGVTDTALIRLDRVLAPLLDPPRAARSGYF